MRIWRILLLVMIFAGCRETYTPKPRGFFRIDFPQKSYSQILGNYPYSFDIPDYSSIQHDSRNPDQPYWINVEIPENKAEFHISYYDLKKNGKTNREFLIELMEETRRLAYEHSIKASAIDERIFINNAENVYGTIYQIRGNAASPMQFFLTDSTQHFLRGAFYIREVPDIDSLRPVIDFLEPDVIRLIETTSWK
ncbi:gliding motility lipoprotein GldD [Maribellus sp. YY47]|uniref:gliding motility lipoprotein GldD n=1 Tax=Maribellus sp. YY47 TaxID=2929486 RepID=UPI002000C3FA|nr:gliding motility lipoprotein GldD [Maribellus sp. YY47]MCK3682927.1 gliding motility lipoprotein GldD [Maribellus sp. YY47]